MGGGVLSRALCQRRSGGCEIGEGVMVSWCKAAVFRAQALQLACDHRPPLQYRSSTVHVSGHDRILHPDSDERGSERETRDRDRGG